MDVGIAPLSGGTVVRHTGKWLVYRAIFSAAIVSLVFAANAFAAAVVQDVKGDVRAATGTAAPAAITKGQNIASGQTLTTGPGSQVVLRFDDDQRVVLNENTQFTITEFQFQKNDPKADRSVFDLVRGAARFVSGLIGQRSRTAFSARTPTATIGIRGTDFMLAQINQTYMQVSVGQIGATNAAGTATFGAGAIGTVASATTLAAAITAAALPAAVAGAFSSLSAAAVGAAGAAAGAGAGAGAGISTTALAVGAGAVAAGAAVASSNKSSTPAAAASTTSNPFAGSWHATLTFTETGTVGGTAVPTITCSASSSGTVDSTGLFTGTQSPASCSGGTLTFTTGPSSGPISGTFAANGTINAGAAHTASSGGVTISCSAVTGQATLTPSRTFTSSQTCTITGIPTGCTSGPTLCAVNLTDQFTTTGTSP